jgi:hypothetical protein
VIFLEGVKKVTLGTLRRATPKLCKDDRRIPNEARNERDFLPVTRCPQVVNNNARVEYNEFTQYTLQI